MSFSSELEYIVAVLNDERLLFQFEDSSSIDVPREVVSSSTVLQQALSDAEKDEDVPFYCPKGYLQSWLRFSAQDAPFAPERLPAADFLGDDTGLQKLSQQASQWLFDAPGESGTLEDRAQVIAALPRHLAVQVLVSSTHSISYQLAKLPQCLHLDALHATFPTITTKSSITFSPKLVPQHHSTDSSSSISKLDSFWSALTTQIAHIPTLTSLELQAVGAEGIKALSPHLSHLKSLKHLDLRANALGPSGLISFAAHLSSLTALQYLDLGRNWICDDSITALTDQISSLQCLQSLVLSDNGIRGSGVAALAASLAELTDLTQLNLASNGLGDEGVKTLAEYLKIFRSLKHLDLDSNLIGDRGLTALASHLSAFSSLQYLHLGRNLIQDEGAKRLSAQFSSMSALSYLSLSGNRIGASGCMKLAQDIPHLSNLQLLDLESNLISVGGGAALAKYLAPTNTCLRYLNIGDNACAINDVVSISTLTTLQHLTLRLSFCKLCSWDRALAPILQKLSLLQHLDLGYCDIQDTDLQALAPHLSNLTSLQYLNLESTGIGDDGVSALALQLPNFKNLTHLNLGDNDIGTQGFLALVAKFSCFKNLQKVKLWGNDITLGVVADLAPHFSHLVSLSFFDT